MLRTTLRWSLRLLLAIAILVPVGGFIAMWPLYLLPKTDISITRTAPLPAQDRPAFEAGVAYRDITPPIGLPKFGYSSLAHDADGFRTRLQSRVFCLKPAQGEPVALVQAELGASSLLLHHRVAELVAPRSDVAFNNLVILATHTHSGPAQYLESDFYNAFGANRPGFDPKVLDFLATRIADAVVEACNNRRAARLGIGQTNVWGLTRNRSLAAWLQNHDVLDKRASADRELEAVDPVMTVVRIDLRTDDGRWLPAGAFTSFAIHGTGIPAFRGPWHGDVWAAFAQEFEWGVRSSSNPPWPVVHATFEGTHGDNNPRWREGLRGDEETARIGTELATAAWRVFVALGPHLTDQVTVASAMRELDLLALPEAERAPLCERAILGAAVAGAANGDEVFPIGYLPLLEEGWPRRWFTDGCQAQKQWMLSKLQLGIPADRMPHRAALQVLRINDLTLVALPWEITARAGSRINARVSAAVQDAGLRSRTVIASHANGYFGYATTPEEYSLQYYEGGHTLYGPGTAEFLGRESARLVSDLLARGSFADMPQQWQFSLATKSYWPEELPVAGARELLEPPRFEPGDGTREPAWRLVYRDVAPGLMALHEPLLSIQSLDARGQWVPLGTNGRPVNDQWQRQLQVRWLGDEPGGMARYELRWHNPPVSPTLGFRFAVAARGGLPAWHSPVFPQ